MNAGIEKLYVEHIRWWSLGFAGWCAHHEIIDWKTYRLLLNSFYQEPVEFIEHGYGLFHTLYCWWIMWSEGV